MSTAVSTDKALSAARKAEKVEDWALAYNMYHSVLARFPSNKRAKDGLTALKPKAVQKLLKAAQVAKSNSEFEESKELMSLAYNLAPELSEIGIALATLQSLTNDGPATLATAERILAREPHNREAMNFKGKALRELGRNSEAAATFTAALGDPNTDAETLSNLGELAGARGDKEAHLSFVQQALKLKPNAADLHWHLARLQKYRSENDHVKEMQALLASCDSESKDASSLNLALFRAYHDIGDVDKAFAYLREANRLIDQRLGYDWNKDAIYYALSKKLIATPIPAPQKHAGKFPIFVSGLPRSGTTLTERILAQGKDTKACGELHVVNAHVSILLKKLARGQSDAIGPTAIPDLREAILSGLEEHSDGSPILIDKMPLNFRWIGYVCAAIPEARFVHMNRDPMAVAWSLYQHTFSGTGNGFIYSFENITRFMVLHREWMQHWRDVCGDYIFDLNYSDLVNDTEATTKALAEFIGLDWHPGWLSPEKGDGQVLTASSEQVRKPIYGGSDQAWKRYESHLKPLQDMLKSAGLLD